MKKWLRIQVPHRRHRLYVLRVWKKGYPELEEVEGSMEEI